MCTMEQLHTVKPEDRAHTAEYVCVICQKSLSSSQSLKIHMTTHTGIFQKHIFTQYKSVLEIS